MPRFRITAEMTTDLEIFVEADSLEEAQEYADTADGSEFTETEGGSWSVNTDATEVEDEK
jgi:hypothetical protein